MKLFFIASGSQGNTTFIQHENLNILIDPGISFKRISDALISKGFNIGSITHVILTHEHIDHVKGLNTLYNNINAPIYLSRGTCKALKLDTLKKFEGKLKYISEYEPFNLGSLTFMPIPLSHDAIEPLGFTISHQDLKIGYVTDTGYIKEGNMTFLKDCDLYYFESNHDPVLLKNSRRPYHTIHRILTEKGHLSNEDSAYYMSQLIGKKTKKIVMAHISNDCNNIESIRKTYDDVFLAHHLHFNNYDIYYASQVPLEVIEL